MQESSGDDSVCTRCGHTQKRRAPAGAQLKRIVGGKKPRVQCGEPTGEGWPCPCRSHFHTA